MTPTLINMPSLATEPLQLLTSCSSIAAFLELACQREDSLIPKTVMTGWAEQKIRDEAPEAQGRTIAMIMKAEPRTVTAIMHAKSPAQTREVITAAFKRAGLPSPFHPIPSPQQGGGTNEEVMQGIMEQTRITADIAALLAEIPKRDHYDQLVQHMAEAQKSYVAAVEALANSVARLEHTMATWENAYLSQVVGLQPAQPPHTPASPVPTVGPASPVPTVIGTQDYEEDQQVQQAQQQQPTSSDPSQDVMSDDLASLPSMQRLQDRSLRHCCERVVQPSGGESRGGALRPFRARA